MLTELLKPPNANNAEEVPSINVFDTYYVMDDKVEAKYKDTSINFLIDVEGEISGSEIKLERTLDPIVFNRTPLKENSISEVKL